MKKNILDQYYTNDNIAVKCYDIFKKYVDIDKYDCLLEPTAGQGAFFKLLPDAKRVGIDLEPKFDGITKMNCFDYYVEEKTAIIGNFPFGYQSGLAIKIFNHFASQSGVDIISSIIPRIWKRPSCQNRLNLNFELIYNEDLPRTPCCFTPKIDVKCCFQIWKRVLVPRIKEKFELNKLVKDFTFINPIRIGTDKKLTYPDKNTYDFCIKRHGSKVGVIQNDLHIVACHLCFIKVNTEIISVSDLKERFKVLDFSFTTDTGNQDSLSKGELQKIYYEKFYLKKINVNKTV